jgi:hypothetical protein
MRTINLAMYVGASVLGSSSSVVVRAAAVAGSAVVVGGGSSSSTGFEPSSSAANEDGTLRSPTKADVIFSRLPINTY